MCLRHCLLICPTPARAARKSITDMGSMEYKFLDDWISAYENAAMLQLKDFNNDKTKFTDLQERATICANKGYKLPSDQSRMYTSKYSQQRLKALELAEWLDSAWPVLLAGDWDNLRPRMGSCNGSVGGGCPQRYKRCVHDSFLNNSFFSVLKGRGEHESSSQADLQGFLSQTQDRSTKWGRVGAPSSRGEGLQGV